VKIVPKYARRLAGCNEQIQEPLRARHVVRNTRLAPGVGSTRCRSVPIWSFEVTDAVPEEITTWPNRPLDRGLADRLPRRAVGEHPRRDGDKPVRVPGPWEWIWIATSTSST
jgi:hypothetical protein